MPDKIETINDHLVCSNGDSIIIRMPPHGAMSKADALRLAAWLVAIADETGEEFQKVLHAVMNR
jgi:hypothetical protein